MKTLSACLVLLCLSLNLPAQRSGGGGGGTGGSRPSPTSPLPGIGTTPMQPNPDSDRISFVYGKVTMNDGSEIPEPAAIESICNNHQRVETYTDSHGNFSFELKKSSPYNDLQSGDMSGTTGDTLNRTNTAMDWRECEIRAVLAGFTSETFQLSRSSSFSESVDVGHLRVQAMGGVEGTVLSVTSLAAPSDARKHLEKARDQERKNKLSDAIQSLQKAVEIYPKYAAAWAELGRVQYIQRDSAGAQHSYEQALAADSRYAKPYLGLAQLAFDAHQWPALLDATNKLLSLNSVSFPMAWFLKSVAQFNLKDFEAAEKTARDGVKADTDHRLPRLEYLLGLILLRKQDYTEATEHMQQFLRLSSNQNDIAEAQAQLAKIEKLSATASTTAPAQK